MKLNTHTALRARRLSLFSCLCLALVAGCLKVESNKPPLAKIVVKQGSDTIAPGASIAFSGTAIKLTLDGTGSSDADGEVVEYLWLRTDLPASAHFDDSGVAPDEDGGSPSTVAAATDSPAPKPMTEVTLKLPGKYRYSLWVTDNDGAVSAPVSVTLSVAP
jgi:hypothetical protein